MQPIRISKLGEERRSLSSRILYRKFLYGSLAATLVFCLGFVLAPTLASEASATSLVSASASRKAIYLVLDPDLAATEAGGSISDSGHGDVVFGEILPTKLDTDTGNVGTMMVKKKTVNVDTNGNYYTVYLSTNSSNNNLNFTYNSSTDTNIYIPASTGTWTTPTSFTGAGWGMSVPGTPIPVDSSAATPTYPNFPSSSIFTASLLDTPLIVSNGSNVYTANYAAVPNSSSPQQIWKAETNNLYGFSSGNNGVSIGDTTNSKFDIYYAIVANDQTLSGTYTGQIVYTALSSSSSLDEVSTALSRDTRIGQGGETVSLAFEIAENIVSAVREGQLIVRMVPHADMVAVSYDPTTLTTAQLSGVKTCPIQSGSFSISGTGTVSGLGYVSCTIPSGTNGTGYDFWLSITDYNYNYVSKYNSNDEPSASSSDTLASSFIYANSLQTAHPDLNGEKAIRYMQEMNGTVCSNTNKWNNQTGSNARIYDSTGTTALLAAGVDTVGISSFTLIDNRDSKTYLVRRLADGNCWMVQNLDLNLATVGTLTSENTDLNSKASWTPDASTIEFDGASNTVPKYKSFDGIGYYNWPAAVANAITNEEDAIVEDSICPKSWKLPTYNIGTSSYVNLVMNAYGLLPGAENGVESVSKIDDLPISLQSAGYVLDGVKQNTSNDDIWTSQAYNSRLAYDLTKSESSVNGTWVLYDDEDNFTAHIVHSRYYGFNVRCVARG